MHREEHAGRQLVPTNVGEVLVPSHLLNPVRDRGRSGHHLCQVLDEGLALMASEDGLTKPLACGDHQPSVHVRMHRDAATAIRVVVRTVRHVLSELGHR